MAQVIWNADIDVYNPKVIPILVARNILKYLSVAELLSFALVSKNTFRTVSDPNLWVSKLRLMGIWESAQPEDTPLSQAELEPLTCLDLVVKLPKLAKLQVLRIHRCLKPYYTDLQSNKPFERLKLFKEFSTPEDQAKILHSLTRYNAIDFSEESRTVVRDKLNGIFEIFENALLRELEIHFDIQDYEKTSQFVSILIDLNNLQTLIDFFLQKSIFDNEETTFFNLDSFKAGEFFSESGPGKEPSVNDERFELFITELAAIFNEESRIIDLMFPQSIPMMYKVSEELISNQLNELLMAIIDESKQKNAYLITVPYLYEKLTSDFVVKLSPSKNTGESYATLIRELLDMLYEAFASEYMREEIIGFKSYTDKNIAQWKTTISKREEETTQSILKYVRVENKNDFLTSFKKVFAINPSSSKAEAKEEDEKNYSEIQAQAKILSENIKSLNRIINPEVALTILNEAKVSLMRLLKFREFSVASVRGDIFSSIQDIFLDVIDSVGNEHLKPGFTKAVDYLKTYKPKEMEAAGTQNTALIEPLVLFFDLINVADLIIQMIDIFYKEEMIKRHVVKHENSILNPALQSKKKLEGLVDKYVADGLNVGIDILMNEIETVLSTTLKDSDYNPPVEPHTQGTKAAANAIKILDENIDLLVDSADKSIVEVFQQEVAERFFQIIVKVLKKSTISVSGSINLISDLNAYHDFIYAHIRTNRRLVMPYFQSLKKVGSIYIIGGSDSKSIGKLVSDLSKFNGIFTQEEIYEFVQRRQDWPNIKRDVEKVMYGFGLVDCVIM